jgi:hypothetical protein
MIRWKKLELAGKYGWEELASKNGIKTVYDLHRYWLSIDLYKKVDVSRIVT